MPAKSTRDGTDTGVQTNRDYPDDLHTLKTAVEQSSDGISEMLLEDLPPGSAEHENAEEIYQAGIRGSNLVKQILAFSRQSEQKKIPVRLQHIFKEVLKLVRATIPTNIKIKHDIQVDCGFVIADPTQLHQVFMILITNAYHAVQEAGGEILIRIKEVEVKDSEPSVGTLNPGKYAMLYVSDTGTGIDPIVVDKIFEPYFTTKRQGRGTGLGLSVVYGIIQEHNGDIKVYSELGQGTRFVIHLPLMEKTSERRSAEISNGNLP